MTSHRRFERCERSETALFVFVFTLAVENKYLLHNFFFAYNVSLCNSVIFEFWFTLDGLRRHGNLKPRRFHFCIEYEPIDRTCQFHYH